MLCLRGPNVNDYSGTYTEGAAAEHERLPQGFRLRFASPLTLLGLSLPSPGCLAVLAVGSHHQALHRDQVVQHGPVSRHLVAAPDRVENPPMVRVGPGGAAGRVKGFLTALGEEIHERPHDP